MKTKLIFALLVLGTLCLGAQVNPLTPGVSYISVSVTGFVANPGVFQMAPVNRLSDALERTANPAAEATAMEFLTPQQLKQAEQDSLYLNFQGLRQVRLMRGQNASHYDLLKFKRTGDLSQNPLLRDGDVITVYPIHTSVAISGNVYVPGEYEFLDGDTLADILALAQGFSLGADRANINIYRYKENRTDFSVIRVNLNSQSAEQIKLQALDRITVPLDSEARRGWKVTVEGNVKAPGEYLVGPETTLYEVLQLCGGPSLRGDLHGAVFANGSYRLKLDPEFERLKTMSLTQITPMEYNYLRSKLRQVQGRYSVDVHKVWSSQGREGDVILRDGDYLFVPENLDMVNVSGQVANPGLIPWVEGKTWDYYVEQAGGFTNNKRFGGVRIIDASSGNWVKLSKKTPLQPGDTIFAAEKSESELWTTVKDAFTIATQLVTIFLGVRAITTN